MAAAATARRKVRVCHHAAELGAVGATGSNDVVVARQRRTSPAGTVAARSSTRRDAMSVQTDRSTSTRARHGAHLLRWVSTNARSAPSSAPSRYGVTSESKRAQLDMDRFHLIQTLEEEAPPPGQARHDRARRDAQHGGNFGVRKLLHIA